jgi:predicted DCC family thiol-disulfide oxidoreductase YuxK
MATPLPTGGQTSPILLFDGKCNVCRHIAGWVARSARRKSGEASLIERPVGDDPAELRTLNPGLNIWDAYATVHVVMPDGSMKLGGEAVAEVLRNLPNTAWLARSFDISVFGIRPFQIALNAATVVLADARPLLGCESCGTPGPWASAVHWMLRWPKTVTGTPRRPRPVRHFTPAMATLRAGAPQANALSDRDIRK